MTREKVAYYRMMNNHLIKKTGSGYTLLNKLLGVQAQSINDALIALQIRLSENSIEAFKKDIDEKRIIRLWGQRNTLHYYNFDEISHIFFINRLIGNWFTKKMTPNDCLILRSILERICLDNETVSNKILLEIGIKERYINNWNGIHIEMCKLGLIYSKERFLSHTVNSNPYIKRAIQKNKKKSDLEYIESMIIRYVTAYGPVRKSDFYHWLGYRNEKIENVFNRLCADFYEIEFGYMIKEFDFKQSEVMKALKRVFVLPKFDNILLAYKKKDWICEPQFHKTVWGKSALVESVIIYELKIVAIWRKDKKNDVLVRTFYDISDPIKEEIVKKINEVFYGQKIKQVHFRRFK